MPPSTRRVLNDSFSPRWTSPCLSSVCPADAVHLPGAPRFHRPSFEKSAPWIRCPPPVSVDWRAEARRQRPSRQLLLTGKSTVENSRRSSLTKWRWFTTPIACDQLWTHHPITWLQRSFLGGNVAELSDWDNGGAANDSFHERRNKSERRADQSNETWQRRTRQCGNNVVVAPTTTVTTTTTTTTTSIKTQLQ